MHMRTQQTATRRALTSAQVVLFVVGPRRRVAAADAGQRAIGQPTVPARVVAENAVGHAVAALTRFVVACAPNKRNNGEQNEAGLHFRRKKVLLLTTADTTFVFDVGSVRNIETVNT